MTDEHSDDLNPTVEEVRDGEAEVLPAPELIDDAEGEEEEDEQLTDDDVAGK